MARPCGKSGSRMAFVNVLVNRACQPESGGMGFTRVWHGQHNFDRNALGRKVSWRQGQCTVPGINCFKQNERMNLIPRCNTGLVLLLLVGGDLPGSTL